jgi:hypothetical protein
MRVRFAARIKDDGPILPRLDIRTYNLISHHRSSLAPNCFAGGQQSPA